MKKSLLPVHYYEFTADMRKILHQIDERRDPQTPAQKRALTLAVHRLARRARRFSEHHRQAASSGLHGCDVCHGFDHYHAATCELVLAPAEPFLTPRCFDCGGFNFSHQNDCEPPFFYKLVDTGGSL